MKRLKILITAGGTREPIDPVRYITNGSSGRMGIALARAALRMWHDVTLVMAPTDRALPDDCRILRVATAADMFAAVKQYFDRCDCLIMTAAVADYTPVRPSASKLKKSPDDLVIRLKPTADILAWAGRHKTDQILVGFALEDKNLRAGADEKMAAKNLDLIVANSPEAIGAGHASVHIKSRRQPWTQLTSTKMAIALKIIRTVEHLAELRDLVG